MIVQAGVNNLYETTPQPDTGGDAYAFLEFNAQGDDYGYPEFHELFERSRSPTWTTAATDSIANSPSADLQPSNPSGSAPSSSAYFTAAAGSPFTRKAKAVVALCSVDGLALRMSGLNFSETCDDDNYEYGKGNFIKHACRYCGVQNFACVIRCNILSCRKWFCNARGHTLDLTSEAF